MVQDVLAVPAGEWLLQTAAGSVLGRQTIQVRCPLSLGCCRGMPVLAVRLNACIHALRLAPTHLGTPVTAVLQAQGHQDHQRRAPGGSGGGAQGAGVRGGGWLQLFKV